MKAPAIFEIAIDTLSIAVGFMIVASVYEYIEHIFDGRLLVVAMIVLTGLAGAGLIAARRKLVGD